MEWLNFSYKYLNMKLNVIGRIVCHVKKKPI